MNYRHLHAFWVVAKAGGVVKAGEQTHTSPQTLSAQIKLLEAHLGRRLMRRRGRSLELTDDGRVVLAGAETIFGVGIELETSLRERREASGRAQALDFRVGVEDAVAKTVAYRLLEPALQTGETLRLICTEGDFDDLMAQLALHRMDLVIADEPLTSRLHVRAFNHLLGTSPISFFCAPALRDQMRGGFPACLNDVPMLIPGPSTSLRPAFERWLTRHRLHPRVVGEFADGALMKAFGREGRGVFVSPAVVEAETVAQYGVEVVGRSDELVETFYAISPERRITHPGVAAITTSARRDLFG